eukprot:187214-Rhodomonas_salina.2
MLLCTKYSKRCTAIGYGAIKRLDPMCGTELCYAAMHVLREAQYFHRLLLCTRYAKPGTDIGYGPTRQLGP